MKTTKKGFTLIELIVVIAIIGVLAAILVPTMLGYVKKSKISSANSSASSVYKAINSALTELDEEGVDVGGLWILTWNGTAWSTAATVNPEPQSGETNLKADGVLGNTGRFDKKVKNFFEDITKIKKGEAAIKGGSCIALAVASDSTYTGTYPGGVVTTDTYEAYSSGDDKKFGNAIYDAILVASGGKTEGADGNKRMKVSGYSTSEDYTALTNACSGTTGSGGGDTNNDTNNN